MLHFYFFKEVVSQSGVDTRRDFVFGSLCMSHSKLVDQLAVVKSLLLGKLQNFMQLQIFIVLAGCVAWSSGCDIEIISWVYSLGLVQHLILHVHLLLNKLLTILIFLWIVFIRC
jgi:hypothetical protein